MPGGLSPNLGANLPPRPIRPAAKLEKFPASTERIHRPERCGGAVTA